MDPIYRHLLNLGGYLNILIAILHIVGLLWADAMFEVVGGLKKWNSTLADHDGHV